MGQVGIAACACDDPREAGAALPAGPDAASRSACSTSALLVNGALDSIAERAVEVHLRSVFLHGLLFFDEAQGGATPISPHVSRLRRLLAEAGADPMQAALAFALSRPEASHVIVGVGSAAELLTC